MIFPTLFKKAKTGKIQEWTITTEGNQIITLHGVCDGTFQKAVKVAKGKNIGKKNETSDEQQAILNAQSMWNKKRDKGYFESIEEAKTKTVFLPMLATDMLKMTSKSVKGIWEKSPYSQPYLQPKMDGVRCLARWNNGKIQLLSRGGKEYHLKHIETKLESILNDKQVLDGELYIHGLPRQDIQALVKKWRDEEYQETGYSSKDVQFWIYDSFYTNSLDTSFEERLKFFKPIFNQKEIKIVPTVKCKSEKNFTKFHKHYIEWGFEGTILRKPDGAYELGHRSRNLIKYKDFMDDEFEVVGSKDGEGKFKGCVIWKCKLPNGGTVDVTPKGSLKQKKKWFKEAEKYIGKLLTVKFQGYTKDGNLEFPTGIAFRLSEDMDNV